MKNAIVIALALAPIASFAAEPLQSQLQQPPGAPGLTAEFLYNGVKRPAIINVASPRGFGTVTLELMDADGKPLALPAEVHPGRVDLGDTLPAIWKLRQTAYLQMMDHDEPVGAALVLQPMLARMVPQTKLDHRPTGSPYSRIIGWVDENDPSMQEPPQSPAAATTAPAAATQPMRPLGESQSASAPAPVERLFTGLRIYPENDVVLHTTKGDIRIAMKPDEAPNTVWNFLELARGGFYRGVAFHRIVPLTAAGQPFVIQAGDPTATGDGGPGYWLPIEDSHLPHDFGVISMARSDDPDSNGSQFFFCLSRAGTARLDGQYCSFGYAVDGAATIKAIAEVELADVKAGKPVDPPLITSAELVPAPPRTPNRGRPDERITPEGKPIEQRPTGRVPR